MIAHGQPSPIAEVHCLNCGRTLADVVRDARGGHAYLRPARNQSAVQVIVAGRNLLRCNRCHGRAFIEPFERPLRAGDIADQGELAGVA